MSPGQKVLRPLKMRLHIIVAISASMCVRGYSYHAAVVFSSSSCRYVSLRSQTCWSMRRYQSSEMNDLLVLPPKPLHGDACLAQQCDKETRKRSVAIVTGGNRGLGFAIARDLGEKGYTVLLACRNPQSGRMAADKLRAQGHDVRFLHLDVARGADTKRLSAMLESSPSLVPHLVVNNAAVCLHGSSADTLRHSFIINFFGALRVQAALFPLMAAAAAADPSGAAMRSVVHVSSGDGELCLLSTSLQRTLSAATSVPAVAAVLRAVAARAARRTAADEDELAVGPTPAYSLSKAALNAAARIVGGAGGAGPAGGVRVVAVCPGDVDTAMLDGAPAGPVLAPAAAAADVVWAACAPAAECPSGGFYRARAPIPW